MAQFSKVLKLGTPLSAMSPAEYILITYNHGRYTWSGLVSAAEAEFSKDLGTELTAITADSGVVRVFM